MAELLIRVVSKSSEDFFEDVKLTKRGDVITVKEDGSNWGRQELKFPEWRIVSFPGASLEEASVFLSEERPEMTLSGTITGEELGKTTTQIRGFAVDIDNTELPKSFEQFLADDERSVAVYEMPSKITLESLKLKKPPRKDPNVIG